MKKEHLEENAIARQIVAEIMSFGATQQQVLQVIYLLSLELEDREKSVSIANIVKSNDSKGKKQNGLFVGP